MSSLNRIRISVVSATYPIEVFRKASNSLEMLLGVNILDSVVSDSGLILNGYVEFDVVEYKSEFEVRKAINIFKAKGFDTITACTVLPNKSGEGFI